MTPTWEERVERAAKIIFAMTSPYASLEWSGLADRSKNHWRNVADAALRAAFSAALGPEQDWRALASPGGVTVEAEPDRVEAARSAVAGLLAAHGVDVVVTAGGRPTRDGVKRRRVRWSDG